MHVSFRYEEWSRCLPPDYGERLRADAGYKLFIGQQARACRKGSGVVWSLSESRSNKRCAKSDWMRAKRAVFKVWRKVVASSRKCLGDTPNTIAKVKSEKKSPARDFLGRRSRPVTRLTRVPAKRRDFFTYFFPALFVLPGTFGKKKGNSAGARTAKFRALCTWKPTPRSGKRKFRLIHHMYTLLQSCVHLLHHCDCTHLIGIFHYIRATVHKTAIRPTFDLFWSYFRYPHIEILTFNAQTPYHFCSTYIYAYFAPFTIYESTMYNSRTYYRGTQYRSKRQLLIQHSRAWSDNNAHITYVLDHTHTIIYIQSVYAYLFCTSNAHSSPVHTALKSVLSRCGSSTSTYCIQTISNHCCTQQYKSNKPCNLFVSI